MHELILLYAKREHIRDDIRNALLQHIEKLQYLNLSVKENLRHVIENEACYREYYRNCLRELKTMKSMKLYDNVSVFNILVDSDQVLSRYARNKGLLKALMSKNFDNYFPIYSAWLKRRVYTQIMKRRLRNMAATVLNNLLVFNHSSHPAIQNILPHLTYEDFKYLCS